MKKHTLWTWPIVIIVIIVMVAGCTPSAPVEPQVITQVVKEEVIDESKLRCTQTKPAGLSSVLIEGAMQQAPQPGRQFIVPQSPRICRMTSASALRPKGTFYDAL